MEGRREVELVLLEGGRSAEPIGATHSRGSLRLVRTIPANDLQAALEETVEAARRVRRDIEERIARALVDLLQPHAPGPGSH
jgi:hypothetical protein